MSVEEYFTNYDSDKNSDTENESQDNQNSIPQSSRKNKKLKHTIEFGNRLVKDNNKFKDRWPLGRFVHKSLDIVHHWSQDLNPSNINCKHFHEIPILRNQRMEKCLFLGRIQAMCVKREY